MPRGEPVPPYPSQDVGGSETSRRHLGMRSEDGDDVLCGSGFRCQVTDSFLNDFHVRQMAMMPVLSDRAE